MSVGLFEHMQTTQRFLRDYKQEIENPVDLIAYINRGRREVAMRAWCLRALTPIAGACTSVDVTSAGSAYSSSPTVSITAPDFPSGLAPNPGGAQATATAIVQAGTIAGVNISYGGSGYFQPQITITDATGSGFSGSVVVTGVNALIANQEVYPFSGVDLSFFPGYESVYMIRSISIIYANYRYSLPVYDFSTYQAKIRQFPFQYTYVPTFASQFGQGTSGSFYVYPFPSQNYQYELDCFCLPQDLVSKDSVEAIPEPWVHAVPYYAAHLAFLELQNYNVAKMYSDLYEKKVMDYSRFARPGRAINPYGRY